MGLETFVPSVYLAVASLFLPFGNTPEFNRYREKWLEEIIREKLLEEFTGHILRDRTEEDRRSHNKPCFADDELTLLKYNFKQYSRCNDGLTYWDKQSMIIYFSSQLSEKSHKSLTGASNILFNTIKYFATFPLLPSKNEIITSDEFIRAIACLGTRSSIIFNTRCSVDFVESTRVKTSIMYREDFFRSLASMDQTGSENAPGEVDEDIVDIMAEVQPILNYRTYPINRHYLRQASRRLGHCKLSIEKVWIEKTQLLALLCFLHEAVDGLVAPMVTGRYKKSIDVIKKAISEIEGDRVHFEEVEKIQYAFVSRSPALLIVE